MYVSRWPIVNEDIKYNHKTTYRGPAMIKGFFIQKNSNVETIVMGFHMHVLKYQVAGGLLTQPPCSDRVAYCARVHPHIHIVDIYMYTRMHERSILPTLKVVRCIHAFPSVG